MGMFSKPKLSNPLSFEPVTNFLQQNKKNSNAELDAQMAGMNMARPTAQTYNSLSNRNVGQFEKMLQSQALSNQPSERASILSQAATAGTQKQLGQAAQAGQANLQGNLSQLAMRGGVNPAARERMAGKMGLQNALQQQMLRGEGAANQLNIQQSDLAEKSNLQKALGQQEMQQNLSDIQQKNAFNTDQYNADMSAWAANKTAQEQLALNKKRGLLGLGVLGL